MLLKVISALSCVLAVIVCAAAECFGSFLWLAVLPLSLAGSFVLLMLLAFLFLVAATQIIDTSKPQEKDSAFYRWMARLYIELLATVLRLRIETRGLEKIPQSGRFMLVCNHLNDSDPAILLHFFKNSQLAFISKRENQQMFVVGKLMHKLQCQLVNRENDREALRCILKCIEIIKEDKASIAVFPEGYVSKDRHLLPFRPGVFKIAQKAKVPIVVCTLQGTEHVIRNMKKLKPTAIQLHLLEVIPAEELADKSTVEVAQRVRQLMANDLGPDYRPLDAE